MNTQLIYHFLSELSKNNSREWMDENRDWYLKAKQKHLELVSALLTGIIPFDEGLQGLEPKDCIFRINRDIRFSKDKTPYKNNFGVYLSEGGKKSANAGYYLHLQPGNESFIGGGLHRPDSESLSKVRQEIDYNAGELKTIVSSESFKKYFKEIQGEKLKRAPKGYDPNHPNIELLKLKEFVVIRKLKDTEVLSDQLVENATSTFKAIAPFINYLNVAVS